MAGNSNLLEAPAQGFGQTVSFTTSPDTRQTPDLDGVARSGVTRGGVQGVPVAGGRQRINEVQAPPPNPTMALLSKVAGGVMQAKLREEKAAAFVTGMQRAAGGEAIKDIAEGEPWFTRIFGDSDVVEGARQYTAQAKAAEAAAAIEDSMPQVRSMGAEESNAYFTDLVKKHLTGDDATDAALMQGFARTLPATMRRQAKEHYAWKQEQASTAESRALLSAAGLLQKRASITGPEMQTDEEYASEAVKFIASMRPAAGRDIESWTKARTADLLNLAQAGQFHAVNAIREAGMLQLLTPEQRTNIESALDTAENRTLATKSFEYAEELGKIAGQAEVFSTDLSPEATMAALRDLNARVRKETGIDRDLVGLEKGTGIIKDVHTTLLREGERRLREGETAAKAAAEAGDKARAAAVKETVALQAIAFGGAAQAARGDGMTGVVQDAFIKAFEAEGQRKGPVGQADLLLRNWAGGPAGAASGDGYVSKAIVDRYERLVDVTIGAQQPDSFLALHQQYEALRGKHPALASAYFGKHAARMELYHGMLTSGPVGSRGEAQAFAYAFGSQELPRPKPLGTGKKNDEVGAVAKALQEAHSSPGWSPFNVRMPLRDDQLQVAVQRVSDDTALYRSLPNNSIDQAASIAYSKAREKGDDMVGGFYIQGQGGQLPLSTILRSWRPGDSAKGTGDDAGDVWDKAVSGYFKLRTEGAGVDFDGPLHVLRSADTRLKDAKGQEYAVANITLIGNNADGKAVAIKLTSDQIKDYMRDPQRRTSGGPVR